MNRSELRSLITSTTRPVLAAALVVGTSMAFAHDADAAGRYTNLRTMTVDAPDTSSDAMATNDARAPMNETDATAATDSTDFGASELPVTSRAGIEYVPPEAEFSAPSDLLSPPTSRAGAEYVPPRYDSFSQWFDSVRSSGAGVEAKATHEPDHGASLRSADPVVGFAVEAESYIALHRESRFL